MRKVISWDHTFMNLAESLANDRSKDPNTQVGCVIVNEDKDPVAFGYNGFASGSEETAKTWQRPEKYDHVIHAEQNAIGRAARRGCSTRNCTVYVTAFPCLECAKTLIAAGIKKVHALKLIHGWNDSHAKAAHELDRAGIEWGIWTYDKTVPEKYSQQ
jgi:dCMP deaminase